MPWTSEQKTRKRYRDALEKGEEPPQPRKAAHLSILAEVRQEVAGRALQGVQAVAHAGQEAVRHEPRKGKAETQGVVAQGKREITSEHHINVDIGNGDSPVPGSSQRRRIIGKCKAQRVCGKLAPESDGSQPREATRSAESAGSVLRSGATHPVAKIQGVGHYQQADAGPGMSEDDEWAVLSHLAADVTNENENLRAELRHLTELRKFLASRAKAVNVICLFQDMPEPLSRWLIEG